MGWGTGNLGGGSGGLNFKIVSYATESELLADMPKENTIGVITSIPITGYHFGTEEPSPAAAGMVWSITGIRSAVEFNALKKNAVQVYPMSAKQYIGGAWVDKTAKSYQGGKWVDWITYFLVGENQFENLTGGWIGNGTVDSNGISMTSGNIDSFDKYMHTANPIDFTQFKFIKFNVTRYYRYSGWGPHWVKATVRTEKKGGGTELALLNIDGPGECTMNVEGVNQRGYLTIQTGNTSYITVETIFT